MKRDAAALMLMAIRDDGRHIVKAAAIINIIAADIRAFTLPAAKMLRCYDGAGAATP